MNRLFLLLHLEELMWLSQLFVVLLVCALSSPAKAQQAEGTLPGWLFRWLATGNVW